MADVKTPAEAIPTPVATEGKQPMSTGAKVAIGCGVLVIISILCAGSIWGLGMLGLNAAEDELNEFADGIDEIGEYTGEDQEEWDNAASVNETVEVEGIEWKILEVKNLGSTLTATDEWSDDCVSDSGNYIYVKGIATNNTDEQVSLDDVYLIDAEGRQFEGEYGLYGCFDEDLLFFEDINPGLNFTFVSVYEVPSDATDLKLQVSNLDWFTEVNKYIDLGL